jgi:hypothetical protein
MNLPPGWQLHPENPAYAFNANGEIKPVTDFTAAAAAPAAPAAGGDPWGTQDMDEAEEDRQRAEQSGYDREDNFFWLNFPELTGNEVSMLMRFFPPWSGELKKAYIEIKRHRIYARLVPGAPAGRDIWWVDCPESVGGPGNCPICRVLEQVAQTDGDFAQMAKAKKSALWQGVNLSDPNAHFQNVRNPQTGLEEPGVVPGVMRVPSTLHTAILNCFRFGNFTDPRTGFPIECIKKRGKHPKKKEMNIEYDAQHHAHQPGPIDEALWPALYRPVDLRNRCVFFPEAEKLDEIANNILAEYGGAAPGAPAGGGWVPHPQNPAYLYNPATGQVVQAPAQAPAVPPAPPAAPPAPAALPPMPAAPPPPPAAPPAAAPAAPPAAPPAPPAAAPAAPPPPPAAPPPPPAAPPAAAAPPAPAPGALPPPVAPGLPPGTAPAAPPPPDPGAAPAAPTTPDQLEASMGTPPAPPAAPGAPPPPPAAPPGAPDGGEPPF